MTRQARGAATGICLFALFTQLPLAYAQGAQEKPERRITFVQNGMAGMFFADLAVVRPEYKDVCDKVFRWLSTTRQDKGNGIYYWSILEGGGPSGPWAHGPAAPVMFFLALNEKFGNAEALDYAKGVTNWVVSAATPERGGYTWDDFIGTKRVNLDYNHGVAGTMAYLAEMYRITGDEKYKEYALGATRWMEKMAVPVDDGYKWLRMYNLENRKSFGEYWTGRCAGAAGTAMGLYRVYMATDDPTAKRLADGSLRWLMDIAEKTEHGYRWPRREGFKEYGNSHGKGAAGVGDAFLYGHVVNLEPERFVRLSIVGWDYDVPKDPADRKQSEYLKYAIAVGDQLKATAIPEAGGYKWPTVPNNNPTITQFTPWYCFGNGQIGLFLARLSKVTGDPSYMEYAKGSVRWLASLRMPGYDKYIGPYYREGWFTHPDQVMGAGNLAATGLIFMQAMTLMDAPEFLEPALACAKTLLGLRLEVNGTYKWYGDIRRSELERLVKQWKSEDSADR